MTRKTAVDPSLPWPEHYARYGFAVVPGLIDQTFCDAALARVREMVGVASDLPLNEWAVPEVATLYRPFFEGAGTADPVFDELLRQPRLRDAIETLFGGPGHWNEERNYYLFLRPFEPKSKPGLSPTGHIDFGNQPIPILYRGFTFQASLVDTEPFSGNITIFPGTHATVQKHVIDHPGEEFTSGMKDLGPGPEPFEFVARAGDVLFMHHLVFHSGNASHAEGRSPRVAIHAEAFRDAWLNEVDPARPGLSPWERSLALNGPVRTADDIEAKNMALRRKYVDDLRKKAEEEAAKAGAAKSAT
ncbi:MAG: phytanoyl-CoA dioxygenase family protein [Planctomycetota bacterium]|nr:phytanoyl-CoA dioxygenase family protein [Planctomycetota bacterium]